MANKDQTHENFTIVTTNTRDASPVRRGGLETRPESQLAGFSTAPERRNTVVHDVFVYATRFNHP